MFLLSGLLPGLTMALMATSAVAQQPAPQPAPAQSALEPVAQPSPQPEMASPDTSWNGVESVVQAAPEPSIWFQADWLWSMRSKGTFSTRDFIGGDDATSFHNLSSFDGSSGERIQAAATFQGFLFEGIYTDWRVADAYMATTLDGVAFNPSAAAGNWSGRDFINSSTFFAPINSAATLSTPANTLHDQSGLGPSTTFSTDPAPTLVAFYHSNFSMVEANVKEADFTFATFGGGGLRLGGGFVHANEDEVSLVELSGTFRAVANSSGNTVSLPNSALISTPGGGLSLISGGGTGFSDGTDGTNIPSQLYFTQTAYTHNDLNGGQLVLDGDLLRFGRFDFGGKIQAGVYDNRATGNIIEVYGETNRDQSVYGRELTNTRNRVSFMGGAGLNCDYHITDHFLLTAGYDVTVVTGLALAPQQVNGISGNFYEVQTSGSIFLQAAHVGLEFSY